MTEGIYFNIDKKIFEAAKLKANKRSIESDPNNEDSKNEYLFEMDFDKAVETEFDEGLISIHGRVYFEGKDLGFLNVSFKPDQELIVSIIETYVKQLNKVKTLLEATK